MPIGPSGQFCIARCPFYIFHLFLIFRIAMNTKSASGTPISVKNIAPAFPGAKLWAMIICLMCPTTAPHKRQVDISVAAN